jgi:flavin-dependent dehydrogenase
VQVREGFTVTGLVLDDGAVTGIRGRHGNAPAVTESARIVVGADGSRSTVARAVRAGRYDERPRLAVAYYSYWRGLPVDGRVRTYVRAGRSITAIPTHDELTLVVGSWPYRERMTCRSDIQGAFSSAFDGIPGLADRMREAERVERFRGAAVPNFFRAPFGPGWVLTGDAGYTRDPVTAQGMSDAFASAELCAAAVDAALRGARSYEQAMRAYQAARDAQVMPMYEFTCRLAALEPLPPELIGVLASLRGDQEAMDRFAPAYGGAASPAEFFARHDAGPAPASGAGMPSPVAALRA